MRLEQLNLSEPQRAEIAEQVYKEACAINAYRGTDFKQAIVNVTWEFNGNFWLADGSTSITLSPLEIELVIELASALLRAG